MRPRPTSFLLAGCVLMVVGGPLPAAEPILVADLASAADPGAESDPEPVAAIGDVFFFWGSDPTTGRELWRSDGTPEGTEILADICPGRCSASLSWRNEVVVAGETLFFSACDGSRACQLWVTDGTPGGTGLVEAFGPSNTSYSAYQVEDLTLWNGEVYFAAADPVVGFELFRTDGTPEGTVLVKDFRPGLDDTGFIRLMATEERLFVSSTVGLWATAGTEAGTELLLTLPERVHLTFMQATLGELLLFTVRREFGHSELWVSDGTAGGTLLLHQADIFITALAAVGDKVFFFEQSNGGVRLWKSDGTVAGTGLVDAEIPYSVDLVAAFDGALYFASLSQLWRSDGTEAGTEVLVQVFSSVTELVPRDDALYFVVWNYGAGEVWKTLGTAETTESVLDGLPGNYEQAFAFGDRLVLSVERVGGGKELAILDPVSADLTFLTATFDPGSGDPRDLVDDGSRLLFVSDTDVYAAAPDPRRPAAELVAPLSSSVDLLAAVSGTFAFATDLWFFGDSKPPVKLATAAGSYRSFQAEPHALVGESLYFLLRDSYYDVYELWVSDGTPLGTEVASLGLPNFYFCWDPPCTPISLEMSAIAGKVFIAFQTDLWRFDPADGSLESIFTTDGLDGCADGFCQVEDLAVAGDQVFFTSVGSVEPRVLWASDGTAEGTRPVLELESDNYFFGEYYGPAAGSLAPVRELVGCGGKLYFVARHPELGDELWVSDGTAAGTGVVRDIRPGRLSSFPTGLAVYDGRLVFSADDGVHGQELWVSDGSAEGTVLFADIYHGRGSSFPQHFTVIDGVLVFAVEDGFDGFEPWRTDLTYPGTRRLGDVNPGRISSSPGEFTASGAFLYFNASDGERGFELFALPRSELHKPIDDVFDALERARQGLP